MAENGTNMRAKIEKKLKLLKTTQKQQLDKCDEMSREKLKNDPNWNEWDRILRYIRDLSIQIELLEEILRN